MNKIKKLKMSLYKSYLIVPLNKGIVFFKVKKKKVLYNKYIEQNIINWHALE